MRRQIKGLVAVLVLLVAAACDSKLLIGFKVAVAAANPFVQRLVTKEVLSPELAAAIQTDFGDVVDVSIRVNDAFKLAGKDKVARVNALNAAVQDYAAIVARGNFVKNSVVNEIATDIRAILDGIAIFYGGTPSIPQSFGTQPPSETELKAKIDALNRKLKN